MKGSIILVALALMVLACVPAAAQSESGGGYCRLRANEFGPSEWVFLGLGDALRLRQRDGEANGDHAWIRTRLRTKDGSCSSTKVQVGDQDHLRDRLHRQDRLRDGTCLQDPVMEQQHDRKGR